MSRWLALVLLAAATPALAVGPATTLKLVPVDREPAQAARALPDDQLAALRQAIKDEPKDRGKRLALVQALVAARRLDEALAEARAWREADAYDLVVVRMIGDIYTELGRTAEARRAYSAVVELLPTDPQAQRALSSVLKQQGDLEGAYARLVAAAALRPKDMRIQLELGDVAQRLGRTEEALGRFVAVVANPEAAEAIKYPAKQRLAQIYAAQRRGASGAEAERLAAAIAELGVQGGVENDVKIYLTWDTDRSDVDLWVTTPAGEKVFYEHKTGAGGESLYDDVTTGYGPESFTARKARRGTYLVQVNYYGNSRSAFREARGEVVVILDEGKPSEQRHVLPYRLFEEKQTVTVARIEVR